MERIFPPQSSEAPVTTKMTLTYNDGANEKVVDAIEVTEFEKAKDSAFRCDTRCVRYISKGVTSAVIINEHNEILHTVKTV